MDLQISNSISRLRYLLILSIVMSHSCAHIIASNNINWYNTGIYNFLNLIADFGGFIGTSVFFFISGYLFYKDNFNINAYLHNIKKRFKSLLIPYFFWNTFVILFYSIIENIHLFKSLMQNRKLVIESNLWEILGYYFHPIANQFWFVKDLFIVCLISFIIYKALTINNKLGKVIIITIFVLWTFEFNLSFGIIEMETLCMFSLGGYIRIYHINIINYLKRNIYLVSFFPLLMGCYLINPLSFDKNYFYVIAALFSVPFGIYITKSQSNLNKIETTLSSASFFIFCFFEPFLISLKKILFYLLEPQNNLFISTIAILMFITVITVSILLYNTFKKLSPTFIRIITGGR